MVGPQIQIDLIMGCTALRDAYRGQYVEPEKISFNMPLNEFERLPRHMQKFIQSKNHQPTSRYLVIKSEISMTITVPIELIRSDFDELADRFRAFKYSEIEHLGRS
jgi:hypothetical protein